MWRLFRGWSVWHFVLDALVTYLIAAIAQSLGNWTWLQTGVFAIAAFGAMLVGMQVWRMERRRAEATVRRRDKQRLARTGRIALLKTLARKGNGLLNSPTPTKEEFIDRYASWIVELQAVLPHFYDPAIRDEIRERTHNFRGTGRQVADKIREDISYYIAVLRTQLALVEDEKLDKEDQPG